VSRHALDELKQQIPLLDYLQAHDWRPARQLTRGRLMGLCPLHEDHQPSFLLDPTGTCSTVTAAVAAGT
jgi:DNA primase